MNNDYLNECGGLLNLVQYDAHVAHVPSKEKRIGRESSLSNKTGFTTVQNPRKNADSGT